MPRHHPPLVFLALCERGIWLLTALWKMSILRGAIFGSLLCGIALHLSLALAQPSGFVSIDCGSNEESYVDGTTGITYTSDSNLTKSGEIRDVPIDNIGTNPKHLWHLRTFPEGRRNCYTLQPLIPGSSYLLRPSFLYGNFDRLDSFPPFDLYLENTFVQTVNESVEYEFIVKPRRSYLTLCLCKTNKRDPFISAIELRPLPGDAIYPVVNATLALRKLQRNDFGSRNGERYRYPDDAFDRVWLPLEPTNRLVAPINTSLEISVETDLYMPPSKVMQTADCKPQSPDAIGWNPSYVPQDSFLFMCIHFAELEKLEANETREFNVLLDEAHFYGPITPSYLKAMNVCSPGFYTPGLYRDQNTPLVVYKPTERSTLSPIVNAIELYAALQLSSLVTDDADVSSLLHIREKYHITKPWTGDPCLPLNYAWEGLVCSNDTSSKLRVISLDLSNCGLSGEISTSLANLTAIVSLNLAGNNFVGSIPDFLSNLAQLRDLDLAGNSLTGSIPDFFANLTQLRELNLSDNNLNGSVPDALLRKKESGNLALRISGNEQLCSSGACEVHQRKSSHEGIVIGSSVSAAILFLSVASSIIAVKTRKKKLAQKRTGPQAVTFSEVVQMTDNFRQKIGEGGYGPVFIGHLCEQDVAVKVLSDKSSQGSKEFYTEISLLSRVHHRNLVSFLGYCDEAENMILIYEYLSKGNLREILSGKTQIHLDWNQRLQIALNAAQGLEYLHSGCKPAVIHRDVKSANIILNDKLEAKLADFGLSKSDMPDGVSYISTAVVGTPGYLDPEYSSTNWLNEKSDVYSFGVVLLELISGQQPIMVEPSGEKIHVAEWIHGYLQKGNHKTVADPNLAGRYNVTSFWRVADVALECTTDKRIKRPSMNSVVIQLKEAIALCNPVSHFEISDGVAPQKSEAFISPCINNPIVDEEIQVNPYPR
ncbi:putative leucine-rich repeat receptor-like serine/threonine-protein kinase At2g19230 isoform X2 [Nymphaea colorata]|uniref:putative leucine-rich repeat receptor-like serine/threonine-protein kinase At2g19230 isoform X2 n=1 Tax=Nymphaea colorata TaxID=210225 RepID=UPI00129E2B6B|nr:putative leucine-rich repeat receptor-like serine/threonine-protein kinase At2g19230 isoform X2 [Nymphaea colorata]